MHEAAHLQQRDASTDDEVVIKAMHVEGSAFKSGQIKTGDTLVSVDGQIVGADNLLAGKLIRWEAYQFSGGKLIR